MAGFDDLGLGHAVRAALTARGFCQPTAIQQAVIPLLLAGRDVLAAAPTGSGKTAAFGLPLLQRLAERLQPPGPGEVAALVLVPTRELALQVHRELAALGEGLALQLAVVHGGVPIEPQAAALAGGVDLLVATPGRLLDLQGRQAVSLARVRSLVLDEADRLLGLGLARELEAILAALPGRRQGVLLSATFPEAVRRLARTGLRKPVEIGLQADRRAAPRIRQWVVPVDKRRKLGLLLFLLREEAWPQVLVFARTRDEVDQAHAYLAGKGITVGALHGDKAQDDRQAVLDAFRAGRLAVLVATDVAARGLDIAGLPAVVNLALPAQAEEYVHRIGRTGRAGQAGAAVSLVSADEAPRLAAIERQIGRPLSREEAPGFEPTHAVPATAGPLIPPAGRNAAGKGALRPVPRPASPRPGAKSAHPVGTGSGKKPGPKPGTPRRPRNRRP